MKLGDGHWSQTESFAVRKDPRVATTPAEFREQFELLTQIRDKLNDTHDAVRTIRSVRTQATELSDRLADNDSGDQVGDAARALNEKLRTVEDRLIEPAGSRVAVQPRLNSQLAWLDRIVGSADARPTDQSQERLDDLDSELTAVLAELATILTTDLVALNSLVREAGVQPIILPRGREKSVVSSNR